MNLKITARHFTCSQELQDNIQKATEKLERFNDSITAIHVILDAEKKAVRKTEIIIQIHDKSVCVSAQENNMHKALESALLKAERQLKKEKEKHKVHRGIKVSEVVEETPINMET